MGRGEDENQPISTFQHFLAETGIGAGGGGIWDRDPIGHGPLSPSASGFASGSGLRPAGTPERIFTSGFHFQSSR